jgi:hypothetical protein
MRVNKMKAILKAVVSSAAVLLLGAEVANAAQQVNLTAGPSMATLPDGALVHMWGYSCGTGVPGSAASCANLQKTGWSPVVITVPTGQDLQINLTNNLTFIGNQIPTSLVIVGQIGGGLGDKTQITNTPSPLHDNQGTTWPIANAGPVFTPPSQGPRVQSFSTEVPVGPAVSLTWKAPAPGTYLLESGTHPSIQAAMGLIGMVVVTAAPNGSTLGTAYPGINYSADVPLLFSEIDPVQNNAVDAAVNTAGFAESATRSWSTSGQGVATINITSPGSGYTQAPTVTFSPAGASATAVIDTDSTSPTYGQVTGIDINNAGTYASAPTISLSAPGSGGTQATAITALALSQNSANVCGGGASACYPSVVNYSPRYYLINGQAFDMANTSASLFAAAPSSTTNPVTGNVLVRMVNAGLRMHIPSIVGSQTGTATAPAVPPSGFSLIAEDGNVLPGTPRVQSEVFMAAGKTYDVMINVPAVGSPALPVFDRQLSLSANSTNRDSGMVGYISINGGTLPFSGAVTPGQANPDTYVNVYPGQTLNVTDASKGVLGNDVNVYNVKVSTAPTHGTVSLNLNGTFSYTPDATWTASTTDSFQYCGNSGTACTTASLSAWQSEAAGDVVCGGSSFRSNLARTFKSNAPGVLAACLKDSAGFPLSVAQDPKYKPLSDDMAVTVDANGSFSVALNKGKAPGIYSFTFYAQNSQGVVAQNVTTVNVSFPTPSGLTVTVLDGADKATTISDYRWIIEEDRTFYVDPACAQDASAPGCPSKVVNFGTNFHTSYMPVIATGCTGDISCENNQTVLGKQVPRQESSMPGDVPLCTDALVTAGIGCLDPNKRYYISVLPGDAAQPFIGGYAGSPSDCAKNAGSDSTAWTTNCGHGMGGAPIAKGTHDGSQPILVFTEPSPYPPATLTVFVFEDDYPLNGEHDAGGGIDILSPNEPGLGGFQITLQDDAGGTGDATGTPTYDMFNMPLSNSLAGTIDPVTKMDACPLSSQVTGASTGGDSSQNGIVGMIITCPKYESDNVTLSPLAGQAVVKNLYQGRYGVVANPGADRIARGEEWLQTNTLDGQKAHDSFMRIGEPAYFQEFGPAGYHVTIGFANPKIINDRGSAMCAANASVTGYCQHEVKGHVTTARMSRTPDERLYGSGTHDSFAYTQCYVSIGDPDGAEFGFTKCDANGNFDFTNVPQGNWKITTFDQWNDQVVDGISTAVGMCDPKSSTAPGGFTNCAPLVDMGEVAVHQWQANIYTRTFLDTDYTGVSDDGKPGLALVPTNIRFRDGSFSNFNNTDLNGFAGFNEVFPLFNWYVIETDSTRYKNSGTHVVYDSGGPVDGSSPIPAGKTTGVACSDPATTTKQCGNSSIAQNLANTYEPYPLPTELSLPGSVYCPGADCSGLSIADAVSNNKLAYPSSPDSSTGRIDGPWVNSYGWQGFSGQNNFLEFGKRPFMAGENGGIHGHVVYASTRPFDDPQLLLQTSWEPLVPHVRINLYKEDLAPDGATTTLTLVDHTETSSFDDWAQGFRQNPDGTFVTDSHGNYVPNISCPGQAGTSDPFYYGLAGQPQFLDFYSNPTATKAISNSAQFKCYDGMHNWNQLQPAPYDGMYSFPSVVGMDPVSGKPAGAGLTDGKSGSLPGTNCTICVKNPSSSTVASTDPSYDPFRANTPMLPDGKYVVEVVVPQGYELVKEEDKNILIGDNFIAPVTQQFGGLGSIFILPDQAEVGSSYNGNNAQNPTNSLGRVSNLPSHEGDTGSVETYWPCVGELRTVPDFISLYPGSGEVSPFAGASRPLCDRKEVTLTDQTSALAKFYIFTSTHTASHFTGVITDDFTAEFDPYSPQFGEKFAPAYLPISFKDWAGNEISRVYSDAFGAYNGLNYSTWEVNPPNPTGYGPTMMVGCMNDPGPVNGVTDPLYQDGYSDFCYELPFMPAQTGYFDTPVVPTSAFAGSYNPPDCAYPDATPAISEVDGDGVGPWVGPGKTSVGTITLTNSGSGYTSLPSVTISDTTPGTGTGAKAVAIDLKMLSIAINNQGSGYTAAPTVTFAGGGAATQTVTATLTGGKVTGIPLPATLTGFTGRPTITIQSPGQGTGKVRATATASMGVDTLALTADGTGYSTPHVVIGNAPTGGTTATATVALGTSLQQLTITALGNQSVDNYEYSGPLAQGNFNKQKAARHYGFGSQCTLPDGSATCSTVSSVTIGGVPASIASWSDTNITVNVPAGVPACGVQQQTQYGGSVAQCGELLITAGNGKQSIDTVTVTVGGSVPKHVKASDTIQAAIDTAKPGDLIIIDPAVHQEMVLMWKPVRLQGVGAASSAIDANPHPAGKLDPWRRQVVCLFGLALNGQPYTNQNGSNPFDANNVFTCPGTMNYFSGGPSYPTMVVDRIPMEGILGWDTTVNGNLAEQLIEPSLMGAYEGAGITVLGKGVKIPAGSTDVFGSGAEAAFPTGSLPLTVSDCATGTGGTNLYPSNYLCNPSSIDGLAVKNSSQGGGGIYVHGWAHNLQIANNRVFNNQGTMSGGITIGQGEHPDVPLVGGGVDTIPPGSCIFNTGQAPANLALPYCYDLDVNVHNNAVTQNSSLGDELFSSTPAGAGGVTFCNGSDYYKFNYNWVCGNMSTGDGAGVAHVGFSYYGDIEHNTILFNQTTNPSIVTNGGGLLIMGAPDPDPPCATNDQDCVSAPGSVTPSDGTGPGLLINANYLVGNSADSGSGGGLRLQHVNGTDVVNFPNGNSTTTWPNVSGHTPLPNQAFQSKTPWNGVNIINNIIANNVAGWDGGGISLLDALAVNVINNTVASNNSTASSGTLFQTLFAPLASTQGTNCTNPTNGSQSCPQVAGLVSVTNSDVFVANLPTRITCPSGHGAGGSGASGLVNASCRSYSVPELYNDLFWKNRAMMIGVGGIGTGLLAQQSMVGVYDPGFTGVPATPLSPSVLTGQSSTGACNEKASFWDIGVRGDTAPGNHTGGTLAPFYSVLTNTGNLDEKGGGTSNVYPASTSGGVPVASIYCNGSRVPVESGGSSWQTPPGTNESNALPAPPFTLLAGGTVDEGNNWINLQWGPLALSMLDAPAYKFDPTPQSPAINQVPLASQYAAAAPLTDFYNNPRGKNAVDIGAIESAVVAPTLTSIAPIQGARGTAVNVTLTGTNLTGTSAITVSGSGVTVSGLTVVNDTTVTATFTIAPSAGLGGARTVSVTTPNGTSNSVNFAVVNPQTATLTSVSPNTGAQGASVGVTLTGTNFTAGSSVAVAGGGGGVSVSGVTVVNSTTITATFVIGSSAGIGNGHSVTVANANGTASNGVSFTVTGTGPNLTSISPTSGWRGTSVPVILTGSNLTGTTAISVSGTTNPITVSNIVVVNSTTVTATFTIPPNASAILDTRTVSVTTPVGTSNTVNFGVTAPPVATLLSISPTSAPRGTSISVTLTGTNFTNTTNGAPITVSGNGITVTGVTVVSSTQITATFNITGGTTAVGTHNVRVTNSNLLGLPSNAVTFTVN